MTSMPEERVLFLYAAPDGGHKECADSVRKTFKYYYSSAMHTEGRDTITCLYPVLGSFVAKMYLEILRYTPQIWNFLYDNRNIEEITREFRELFSLLNASKLDSMFREYRPTAFVCTHALPCEIMANLKRRGKCNIPLIGIVTDYAVHSYWVHHEIDLYIVANHKARETLVARGIPIHKIKVCGIPTDPAFNLRLPRKDARKRLSLDEKKPVVLIMGGARGIGPITEITQRILYLKHAPQLIIVTGTNKELWKDLRPYHKLKNVHIYGYTRLIPIMMDAADILVTKPGGITSSEALIKKLPMILVNPIPGQEARNARYLIKHGAAIRAKEVWKLGETVKNLLSHPERLKKISEKAGNIATPNASRECCKEILNTLNSLKIKNEYIFSKFSSQSDNVSVLTQT